MTAIARVGQWLEFHGEVLPQDWSQAAPQTTGKVADTAEGVVGFLLDHLPGVQQPAAGCSLVPPHPGRKRNGREGDEPGAPCMPK